MIKKFKFIDSNRGYLLTIMIILLGLLTVTSIFSYFDGSYILSAQNTHKIVPSWFNIYFLITFTVNLVALAGIWFWQKWAFYLDISTLFIFICIEIYILGILNPISMLILLGTVNLLFYWAIYTKWKYFK